jgi:hypothetical protein
MQDGKQTYALLDERAPNARRLDRDEALAELARRYFTGHGPATERDLRYWATLTVTDVRKGLAAVSDQLYSFEHDGRTYWHAGAPPPAGVLQPRAHLLQILDEAFRGYQDSRYALDADGLVKRDRAVYIGMVLVDGQMVGDMRRTNRPPHVTFEVRLFRSLNKSEVAAMHAAADRYADFLGLAPTVVTSTA